MYQSTRSASTASAKAALLQGIAPDGGLFVDPALASKAFDIEALRSLSYEELAAKIIARLLPGFEDCAEEIVKVYPEKFDCSEITPLVKLGEDYVLELFHGPTSAFKDLALSVLPRMMSFAKQREGLEEKIVVLTATSGDTGKAALEGFKNVKGTEIVVFFPNGGVSEIQRLQMVSQEGGNVRVFAVNGNFDDCQRGVKEAFAAQHEGVFLSSANSINIGRLIPQVVYYFYAYFRSGVSGKLDFVVPSGNFGDILAGYIAKLLGLPVGKLICASNSNSVLYDFLSTGTYDARRKLIKTLSPSMDILVSSNLERLLFYASGGDWEYVSFLMKELKEKGCYTVTPQIFETIRESFAPAFCSEEGCLEAIGSLWSSHRYLCDTHTAVAYSALSSCRRENPCVVLSTASPFKFPTAVLRGLGETPSENEFENLSLLSSLSGISIPRNLAELSCKPVLHSSVIEKSEIIKEALK